MEEGCESPTIPLSTGRITVRPLIDLLCYLIPLLEGESATEEPKLCVSDGGIMSPKTLFGTKGITHDLPDFPELKPQKRG